MWSTANKFVGNKTTRRWSAGAAATRLRPCDQSSARAPTVGQRARVANHPDNKPHYVCHFSNRHQRSTGGSRLRSTGSPFACDALTGRR